MIYLRSTLLCLAAAAFSTAALAQLSLRDDMGRGVIIKKAPERIVTLAPFLTELVYAAGAGDLLVGVDSLSVYPAAAQSLPKVLTGPRFSVGQLAPLKPDLVLAWRDGIGRDEVEAISAFGATVFVAQARSLDDVPRLLELIGRLTGRNALPAMARFETQLERVRRENAGKLRLHTFVEIWNRPLTTVSGNHFLTEALDICRADNVFAELSGFAPKISWEALNSKNPYVILGAGSASSP
ncbi:MAG TPA: helical backbone metal receptor, partial [Myxococcota bacterium]|nr:helical backbone metal receptor [Myxococcota bacterium]